MLAGLFVWILAAADVSDETISSMPLKKDSSSKTISPNLKTEMKSGRAIGPRNLAVEAIDGGIPAEFKKELSVFDSGQPNLGDCHRQVVRFRAGS